MQKNSIHDVEVDNLIDATSKVIAHFEQQLRYGEKRLVIRPSFFKTIHKFLLAHKPKEAGIYRSKLYELDIKGKTFTPSEAWKIESEMIELADFINNKRKWWSKYDNLFLKKISNKKELTKKQHLFTYKIFIAWYIHHKLVVTHPFTDGNGRMARLIMCLILGVQGLANITYPVLINSIINKNKARYLNALNKTDNGNYFAGVEYMTSILTKAYNETVKEGEMIKKEFVKKQKI